MADIRDTSFKKMDLENMKTKLIEGSYYISFFKDVPDKIQDGYLRYMDEFVRSVD